MLIELIDEDDLFRPLEDRMIESDLDEDDYSVVFVDEEDVRVLDCLSPPHHTDVHLVPRHQSPAKIHQHRQRQAERTQYLTARGHVNVGRTTTKKKKITPLIAGDIEASPRHRRINVLVLQPESDASPPTVHRSIEASPKTEVKNESLSGTVTQSDLKMTNIDVQLASVSSLFALGRSCPWRSLQPNTQRRHLLSQSKTTFSTVHPAPAEGGADQAFRAALQTTQKT